jgi:hypothetical protein
MTNDELGGKRHVGGSQGSVPCAFGQPPSEGSVANRFRDAGSVTHGQVVMAAEL